MLRITSDLLKNMILKDILVPNHTFLQKQRYYERHTQKTQKVTIKNKSVFNP